jgi:hypothetical protein
MQVLISIDDTDNLESRGTGHLAAELALDLERKGWATCSFITRHQLFVHADVPYTSHNSAMCFTVDMGADHMEDLITYAARFLENESAPGSDPGLCVAVADRLTSPTEIIAYGLRAKQQVITKAEAMQTAKRYGIHLSEHGGTGGGIIGALAGIGLRLSGNDGRVKGKLIIASKNGVVSVADVLAHGSVDKVQSLGGFALPHNESIRLGEKGKAVFLEGLAVVLAVPEEESSGGGRWRTISRQALNGY